jgi:hypothetical protein
MKTKTKYVDEVTGREYDNKEECLKAEAESIDIRDAFAFWKKVDLDHGKCIQRDKEFYDKILAAFDMIMHKYHPNIIKEYNKDKENGPWRPEAVRSYYVMRVMDDSGDYLYHYTARFLHICSKCFREWDQQYFANNCKHDGTSKGDEG